MDKLDQSKQLFDQAIAIHSPQVVILGLSGGNDSLTTYYVAKALSIKIDYILHCWTRTGIEETTHFVRNFAQAEGIPYLEADAGTSYEDYVMRKGFFGKGNDAHKFAYHILKAQHLRKAISSVRLRRRNFKVLILNGARIEESANRALKFGDRFWQADSSAKNNIWLNLIHYWSKQQCNDFLAESKAKINPVSRELCRSAECMCGTMQSQQARYEASCIFPEWGKQLDALEAKVKQRFPWGWGENIPKSWQAEKFGQLRLFDDNFQPMCSSCISGDM